MLWSSSAAFFMRTVQRGLRECESRAIIMPESLQKRPAASFPAAGLQLVKKVFADFFAKLFSKLQNRVIILQFFTAAAGIERERKP